jgi:hypothetical protein
VRASSNSPMMSWRGPRFLLPPMPVVQTLLVELAVEGESGKSGGLGGDGVPRPF